MENFKLSSDMLKNSCINECSKFVTTAQIDPLEGIIGQERAVKAINFGLTIKKKGYNVFVSGLSGTGRNSYVNLITERKAMTKKVPEDWIYVYNFSKPDNPMSIKLKPGQGKVFKKAVENTIVSIKTDIENAFVGEEYERTKSMLLKQINEQSEILLNELNQVAAEYNFRYTKTDRGLVSIPLKDGNPMTEEDLKNLTPEQYDAFQKKIGELNLASIEIFNKIREIEEQFKAELKKIDSDYASKIVAMHISKLESRFKDNEKLQNYLEMINNDIIENVDMFKKEKETSFNPFLALQSRSSETFFERYKINLFIDNSDKDYSPVIIETNPTYNNLLGSIEYENQMGVLKTNFSKIKPGSLHAANGGYLIIQVRDILENIYTWKGLLRSLLNQEIKIENIQSLIGYPVTTALKPEPIPLDLKVILVGDPYTYSILYSYDEQFSKLFKVRADFDVEMKRNHDNVNKMVKFISAHCEKENLKHFDRDAVLKVVEYSSRLASHQKKLSSRFNRLVEILFEADAWADVDNSDSVKLEHINKAIAEKIFRNNMYEEKILEMFSEGSYLIDVDGEKIGEINGLAVVGAGEYSFGKPSKITVSTYRGKSGLINIEREARTSGKIHDKGVMIINGFLGYKYAQEKPLALSASIVFEQLYSGVDGDSASSTELYAILSSLAEIPINQSFAVTGSVNQKGEIQPIGGVNEKIEGFYKVCKIKGLNGKQGVLIPHQNVKNLMLDDEVIEAVKEGTFSIYAIENIDQGVEILTGVPAGGKDKDCKYQKGTIHYLVNEKLKRYAKPLNRKIERSKEEKIIEKDEKNVEKEDINKKVKL